MKRISYSIAGAIALASPIAAFEYFGEKWGSIILFTVIGAAMGLMIARSEE